MLRIAEKWGTSIAISFRIPGSCRDWSIWLRFDWVLSPWPPSLRHGVRMNKTFHTLRHVRGRADYTDNCYVG